MYFRKKYGKLLDSHVEPMLQGAMRKHPVPPAFRSAEKLRRELGLSTDAFSIRLGYSAAAYRIALKRKILSRWMSHAIDGLHNS